MKHCVFLRDSTREFQTLPLPQPPPPPPQGKKSFSTDLKREAKNYKQRCQESAASQRDSIAEEGQNDILKDTLKTDTSNFVVDPCLYWKPMECSEQWCCSRMPGLTEDKSDCTFLHAQKIIHFYPLVFTPGQGFVYSGSPSYTRLPGSVAESRLPGEPYGIVPIWSTGGLRSIFWLNRTPVAIPQDAWSSRGSMIGLVARG